MRTYGVSLLSFAIIWILVGCISPLDIDRPKLNYSASPSITRIESLRIAESYLNHSWKPTVENIYHGYDAKGIFVNTPDISLDSGLAARPGWWVANQSNTGIPYMWGGFDTPVSFDEKLKRGYYAGDVYTQAKRAKLYSAVSSQACGIDCSGFISRCWRLSRAYSTRELPSICDELASFDDLQPGDIVNKHNTHVLLFDHFLDQNKKWFMAYETGSPPSWKVLRHKISVDYVKGLGYRAYRYRNMR